MPQHIAQKVNVAGVAPIVEGLKQRIAALKAELAQLLGETVATEHKPE